VTGQEATISETAHAKVNLTLEVIARRSDGYHEIASVVQLVDLHDTLYFEAAEGLRLSCNIPELVSPYNMVVRAARALLETGASDRGTAISLDKAIPLAGGLGGGSSDAAAALRALNRMWGMNLHGDGLRSVAERLGSDVPFLLTGKATAVLSGRGEGVTPLPPLGQRWLVLVRPPLHIPNKTREMYARVMPSHHTDGSRTLRMAEAIRDGGETDQDMCWNVFDDVAFGAFPVLDEYRRQFLAAGAGAVHLTGSGPCMFAFAGDRTEGETIARRLEKHRMLPCLISTLPANPVRS